MENTDIEVLMRDSSRKRISISSIDDNQEIVSYSYAIESPPIEKPIWNSSYRWYVLGLFCLVAALENATWNTWGPIEASAILAYNWDKATISFLADYGAIVFVLFVFPSAWQLDTQGKLV